VISEYPERWRAVVRRCARINASHRSRLEGTWGPDRNDEYRFYQVLAGMWPADALGTKAPGAVAADLVDRLDAYMLKAIKEAKLHTSWINDNASYDEAVSRFVRRALTGSTSSAFLDVFLPFVRDVAMAGVVNSLAQVVLKIASPGVPDFYQGTELWDLHLVDPDNRQLVDFSRRAAMLAELEGTIEGAASRAGSAAGTAGEVRALADSWSDGRIKLFVTSAGLRLRRSARDLFLRGTYVPLEVAGERAMNAVTFARTHGSETVIAVVPRFVGAFVAQTVGLPLGAAVWGKASVELELERPASQWHNVLTGERIQANQTDGHPSLRLAEIFANCPVGLLVAID
jgi:(1->4)-alpha-D-glucan 1-alpha-D-glucosylmutase